MIEYWASVVITLFGIGSVFLFIRLYFQQRKRRKAIEQQPLISPEVREARHRLANEATKLSLVTRQITSAENPLEDFIRRLHSGGQQTNGQGRRQ